MRLLIALVAMLTVLPMAAPVAATPNLQIIAGKQIATAAGRVVRDLKLGRDSQILAPFSVADQRLAPGRVTLVAGSPMVTPSFINVPVTIEVNGRIARTVYTGYRVQAMVRTAVAARDLVPGSVLQVGDVEMARVPFTGQPGNGTDVLIGRKVTGAFVKGMPIFIEATSVDQIVRAGSSVILIVRDGAVALTADVLARTSGGLGDQVSVYNPATRKQITGIVTGPGRVELELPGGDAE
ncbi:MAG: flagellar basal body P-ring formation chaperone FlgA [Candidatus Eremiobacteraeota bacterium]|nr:flagellar basal body P-ring formation chaperone FlgA [Candidatus Eremiobacteraeota bacterium]